MKVVLFCGGAGMRLRGYVDDVPKPMVHIGARPILWHLMKYYAHFGHKDFILCLGYKGDVIKDYFLHYDEAVSNDFVWSHGGKKVQLLNRDIDDWTITFVETGISATIGERLKAVEPYLKDEEMFLANYGDGLSDLNLPVMIDTFRQSTAVGSLLLVQPTASFDIVTLDPDGAVARVSALSQVRYLDQWRFLRVPERDFPLHSVRARNWCGSHLHRLIEKGALLAKKCTGFWQCMDTFKDKQCLEELNQRSAPWKVWSKVPADTDDHSRAATTATA